MPSDELENVAKAAAEILGADRYTINDGSEPTVTFYFGGFTVEKRGDEVGAIVIEDFLSELG